VSWRHCPEDDDGVTVTTMRTTRTGTRAQSSFVEDIRPKPVVLDAFIRQVSDLARCRATVARHVTCNKVPAMATDPLTFRLAPPRPANGHPAVDQHAVQFYEKDDFLLEGVTRFVAAGISDGDCSIVIATKAHRVDLEARLVRRGLDLNAARRRGSYLALDAAETLAKFIVGHRPDAERFDQAVGALIERSVQGPPLRRVRAFGEMVALLWAAGNPDGAIELERLWNELAKRQTFSLLCGYPMQAFAGAGHGRGFAAVNAAHGHVAPTEAYLELDPDERLRAVAELQQRVAALEVEVGSRG
jgi:DcmR-like sensory protein